MLYICTSLRNLITIIILLFLINSVQSQVIRIAILDFDNISGIAKYDGLGKAMSSMLISDIESNVSPKRLQLVERAQLQKILVEQKFQATSNVNKATAVQAGKILGVKYLLVGDVFILNDQLVINTRLANTETGDIIFSKKQEGKLSGWLTLKTNIARDLAGSLSMPFTVPRIADAVVSPAILTTYASAIEEKDKGNFEKAEILISTAKEFDGGFGYLDDLKEDVEKLKKVVAEQGKKIEVLEKSGGRIIGATSYKENLLNFYSNLTTNLEKEQIVLRLIREFPENFDSAFTYVEFLFFHQEYDVKYGRISDEFSFKTYNAIISPLLITLDTVQNKNLFAKYLFLKSIYLINSSYESHISDIQKFDAPSYEEFKSNSSKILSLLATNEEEKNYYKLFLYSGFYGMTNLSTTLHPEIQKDIIENFKILFGTLDFNYVGQVLDVTKEYNNNDKYYPYYKSNAYNEACLKLLAFIASEKVAFKNVFKKLEPYLNTYHNDLKDLKKEKPFENNDFMVSLEEYCADLFAIPSVLNNGKFKYNSSFTDKYLIGDAYIVKLDDSYKNQVISLDSVNRRYKWIYEYTDTMKFESPCDYANMKSVFLKKADSSAFENILFILSDHLEIGTRLSIVFNTKKDTIPGLVIGKTAFKNNSTIEILETSIAKKVDKSRPVLLKVDDSAEKYYIEKSDIDYKSYFDDQIKECEEIKKENKIPNPE
jgi:TolB-like protein